MGKRKIDVCVLNELTIRRYSWFRAREDRQFRCTAMYMHSKREPLVTKVPDADKEMDLEMIRLRVNTLQTLHIIGAYLDTAPTVGHAALVQARFEESYITSKQ